MTLCFVCQDPAVTQHSSNTEYATLDLYNPFDNTTGVSNISSIPTSETLHTLCVISMFSFAAKWSAALHLLTSNIPTVCEFCSTKNCVIIWSICWACWGVWVHRFSPVVRLNCPLLLILPCCGTSQLTMAWLSSQQESHRCVTDCSIPIGWSSAMVLVRCHCYGDTSGTKLSWLFKFTCVFPAVTASQNVCSAASSQCKPVSRHGCKRREIIILFASKND